ncbi:MAG: ribose-5-phosphate isomerase RpiA [Thermomicrobiales bacterium]|nr:ribose-5-phosphate isomerase RpiA [Thermomicrobiales bacterium]
MNDAERLAKLATDVAARVEDGSVVGLGSGSTAEAFVAALGARAREGLRVRGVSTSERTSAKAREAGVELVELADHPVLDIGVDGADEIDPSLDLVKGRGGALLYEKIVADACQTWIIVASSEKLVSRLGTRLPLPVEVIPFGWEQTARAIRTTGLEPKLRVTAAGEPYTTDGGHYVLDCQTMPIDDSPALAVTLKQITGVVDHGLFIGQAEMAVTIDPEGEISVHRRGEHRAS